MPHIEMNPVNGIFIKCAEISLFYPLYAIINYQHINATGIYNSIKQMKSTTGFYRGIHFNLLHLPANKFIDLQIYKHYDSSFYAALLSSTFKMLTYPLSTCEVYYLLNNKLPRKSMLYNGFSLYYISNTFSYMLWYKSLNFYNDNITIKNYNIKNAVVGLVSGLTIDIIMNPIRVIKTNYQNATNINSINSSNSINIFKNIRFLDRGLKVKLLLSCLQSSFFNTMILWKY